MSEYVIMQDIRAAGMCAKGVMVFMRRHGLDPHKLAHGKMTVAEVEATGDAMALKVTRIARGRQ